MVHAGVSERLLGLLVVGAMLASLMALIIQKVLNMSYEFDTTGLETYATDADREASEGVWLKFPGNRRFRVLRAGGANKKFGRVFSRVIKPYKRQIDRNTLDPETSDDLMLQVYLEAVILDWDGFKDVKGREIPYSPEAARAFLKQFPEVFTDIVNFASEAATFQEREVTEAAEDLGKS